MRLIYILSLFVCVSLSAAPIKRSDSGIYGPKYEHILARTEKLASDFPGIVEVIDYGQSVQQRTLRMAVAMNREAITIDRPAILMTGSIHGNEYLNIEDRLPQELLEKAKSPGNIKDYLDSGGVFVFVPIVNPDGYESRQRNNANGKDLNRDWNVPSAKHIGFKEVETKALAAALERLRKQYKLNFRVTIDYHCCAGALLTPWSYSKADLPEPALSQHRAIGKIADSHLKLKVGATGQVLGYSPLGTTKDYYYATYGALAFTYEGRYGTEDSKLPLHVKWWDEMVGYVQNNLRPKAVTLFEPRLLGLNPSL